MVENAWKVTVGGTGSSVTMIWDNQFNTRQSWRRQNASFRGQCRIYVYSLQYKRVRKHSVLKTDPDLKSGPRFRSQLKVNQFMPGSFPRHMPNFMQLGPQLFELFWSVIHNLLPALTHGALMWFDVMLLITLYLQAVCESINRLPADWMELSVGACDR